MLARRAIALVGLLATGCAARPTFRATPSTIGTHEDAKLTWRASGLSAVTITPDVGAVLSEGWVNVAPRTTTVYTLTARGPKGIKIIRRKVTRR